MIPLDIIFRRLWLRLREILPGPTTASRLRKRNRSTWQKAPPQQQASAYAQYFQTQQQLRQIHLSHKIAPKIIDAIWRWFASERAQRELAATLWLILVIYLFVSLFSATR